MKRVTLWKQPTNKIFIPGWLFILFFSTSIFAQSEYISADHRVYPFLERLISLHVINEARRFEIPVTRKYAADQLLAAQSRRESLDPVDQQLLDDLIQELSYDINARMDTVQSLIGAAPYSFLSNKPKYIYHYSIPGKGSLFVNLYAEFGAYFSNQASNHYRAGFGSLGGIIRGTMYDHVGFYLKGINGNLSGDKNAVLLLPRFKNNWNLNADSSYRFVDETEGYISFDYDKLKFKLSRDRYLVGYGTQKLILGDHSPVFDYLSMDLDLGVFTYSFAHAKLLGKKGITGDTTQGTMATVEEKYFGYHRLGFRLTDHLTFGAGELVIYANRPLDISYLNPFSFYKAVEHSNQDRDNSLLFFDINDNSFKGLNLYATLLLDDIDYSKLGTGWFGNQTALQVGARYSDTELYVPFDVQAEYYRIDPYVFTHRFSSINYTNNGAPLGINSDPNSEIFAGQIFVRPLAQLQCAVGYQFRIHGANHVNSLTGNITNVGGDVNLGHREFDSKTARFLEGDREYFRRLSIDVQYEPVIGYIFSLDLIHERNTLANNVAVQQWVGYCVLRMLF